MSKLLLSSLLVVCLASGAGAVPVVAGLTDGSNGNRFPWDTTGGMHWQQVFAASNFAGHVGETIDQIAYQWASVYGGSLGYQIDAVIRLSTSLNATGSLDTTFANNVGSDNTLVFSQTGFVVGSVSSSGGFDFALPLSTPFLYTGGDLLLDVVVTNGTGLGDTYFLSNADSSPLTQRNYGVEGSPAATSGIVDFRGFATQFNFVAAASAPEIDPGTASLPLTFSLLTSLLLVRRRRLH